MKKLLFLSFLILFVIKGFTQTIYNKDSTKSYSVKNGSYVEDKTDGEVDYTSININYGENDIYSVGVRFFINETILDFGFGKTIKNNNSLSHTTLGRIGIGRTIGDIFSVGVDYIYTEELSNLPNINNYHNIGLFLSYKLVGNVDLNFTTNSLTGNSVGLSLKLK